MLKIGCSNHANKNFVTNKQPTVKSINDGPKLCDNSVTSFHQHVVDNKLRQVEYWLRYSDLFCYEYKEMFLNSLSDGTTALCKAIEQGHEKMVRGLSKHPIIDINRTGKNVTSLILALSDKDRVKGQVMAQILLARPLDKNLDVTARNPNTGNAPLHIATHRGYKDIVKLLVKHPKILLNEKNNSGDSPLHIATVQGYKDIIEVLVKHPKILLNEKSKYGYTPLDLALHYDCQDIATLLVQHPRIIVNDKNKDDNNRLDIGLYYGDNKPVVVFMHKPKVLLNEKNKKSYRFYNLAS